MKNIVLFGPPGCGKGTQSERLKIKYNWIHISTGDLFRYHLKNKTSLGLLIKSHIEGGTLVPDELTINVLKDKVYQYPQAEGFIFDGFPRTIIQAEILDEFLKTMLMEINAVISLEVEKQTLVQRLLERGKTSSRLDDQNVSKIKIRFDEYHQKTNAVKNYYKKQYKYHTVDGSKPIEKITLTISKIIDLL